MVFHCPLPSEEANGQVPDPSRNYLVEITRKAIRGALDVVHDQVPAKAQLKVGVFVLSVGNDASRVHVSLLGTAAVDDRFLEPVVSVAAKHVLLAPYRHSALDIEKKLRGRELRRDREPLSLASHVGSPRLRIPDRLWFEERERFLERCGRTFRQKLGKEVDTATGSRLVHARNIEVIAHADHAIAEGMDGFGRFAAVLVPDRNFPPLLARARDHDLDLFPEVLDAEWRLVPIADFAVGPGGRNRDEGNDAERTLRAFERPEDEALMPTIRPVETCAVGQESVIRQPDGERDIVRAIHPPTMVVGKHLLVSFSGN